MRDTKLENGLVLAMIDAGFIAFPVTGGYTIALHADLHSAKQKETYERLIGALQRSPYATHPFFGQRDALVWGANMIGLAPVADAPAGPINPQMTVADLQALIGSVGDKHIGKYLDDPGLPKFSAFATLMAMLTEEVGALVNTCRKHPGVIGDVPGFRPKSATMDLVVTEMVERQTAAALFALIMIARRCGADLSRIADVLPEEMARRLAGK